MKAPWLLVAGDFVKTGGMDRANYGLATYLAEEGRETHLVAYRVDRELASMPNTVVHRVPKLGNSYTLAEPFLGCIGRSIASKISRRGGRVLVNGGNCNWPDVNWVHYVHAAYRRETTAGVARRFKLALANWMARASERRALARASTVITNSNRTRDDLVRLLRIPASKVHTIYCGIDAIIFNPASAAERLAIRESLGWANNTPRIAFVGAIGDRRKGFDILFEAWKILCGDPKWDAELVVIGTGAEAPMWKERTQQLGLEHRIHFLGFRDDVPRILRACDAMVAPARYEAYGLNVHEALCCGIPAIVSSTAGVSERYPANLRDLLLPDPENVNALVQRMLSWRANLNEWRERVLSFSNELRRYTWNDMARDIVGVSESGILAGDSC